MEGVGADAEVETLLTRVLDEVLVGANTGGLEGLGAQLLILVGDEVDAEREVVDGGTLAAKIEDANLGVGDTTVEARLGVRLGKKMSVFCWRIVLCDAVVILRSDSSHVPFASSSRSLLGGPFSNSRSGRGVGSQATKKSF